MKMLHMAHSMWEDTPYTICSVIAARDINDSKVIMVNDAKTGFDPAVQAALERVINEAHFKAGGSDALASVGHVGLKELDSGSQDLDELIVDEEEEDTGIFQLIEEHAERDDDVRGLLEDMESEKAIGTPSGQPPEIRGEDHTAIGASFPIPAVPTVASSSELLVPRTPVLTRSQARKVTPVPADTKKDKPPSHPPFQFPEVASIAPASDTKLKIFGIDLLSTLGRTRVWSGMSGKMVKNTQSLTLEDDADLPLALNKLEYDSFLDTVGCGYMPDYEVIVCKSMREGLTCGIAVPLENLMSHCFSPKSLGESSKRWQHGIDFCKIKIKKGACAPNDRQREFMQGIMARYPNIVATIGELRDLRPLPNQSGPIKNIRPPVDGRICSACDFALPEDATDERFSIHWLQHGNVPKARRKKQDSSTKDSFGKKNQVQCFAYDQTKRWIAVRILNHSSQIPGNPVGGFHGTLLARTLAKHPTALLTIKLNKVDILPFFTQIGAARHIRPYNAEELVDLVALPEKNDELFRRLQRAATRHFQDLCESVNDANIIVRQILLATYLKPGGSAPFSAPLTKPARASYALEEVRLLCLILRCVSRGTYTLGTSSPASSASRPSTALYHLSLSKEQLDTAQSLLRLLGDTVQSDLKLVDAIRTTLGSIYMPQNTLEMFNDNFISPVIAYICLRSVHSEGHFESPKLLSTHYVKTQFGIRLYLLEFVQSQYKKYLSQRPAIPQGIRASRRKHGMTVLDSDEEDERTGAEAILTEGLLNEGEEWTKYISGLSSQWLAPKKMTPFAVLKEWIHVVSNIARNMPAPAVIIWNDAGDKVQLHGHLIDICDYKTKLSHTLRDATVLMDKKVLLGIVLSAGARELPEQDDYDQRTRGHGLFSFSLDDIQKPEHPASFFLEALCTQGKLCKSSQEGDISWDYDEVLIWLANVADMLSHIYLLLHMLSPPGRGSEEVLWQHANSAETRRHLFRSKALNTLIMIGNYDKGSTATGLHKCIVRVIQGEVAVLLSTFLRVVRPLELLLTLTFFGGSTAEKEAETMYLYQTRLFVSFGKLWDSEYLSRIIRDWYSDRLGISSMGLAMHRHFAQALQRRLYSKSEVDLPTRLLSETANLALGHGREAGEMNYARQDSDVLTMTQQERFERVGKDWIGFLGFKVPESSGGFSVA